MHARPYKLIIALLLLSVLSILVLQGFWIRNFYFQKKDEFNSTVYSALEKVNTKLRERENMHVIKDNISVQQLRGKPGLEAFTINKIVTSHVQVRNTKKDANAVTITLLDTLKKNMAKVRTGDSSLQILSPTVISKTQTIAGKANSNEVNALMNKMLTEIKIIDDDERNGDTIRNVIRRVFANKGIFIPFEFSLKKVFKNKDETIAGSPGFNEKLPSFVADLSADNVFSTHNYLFVQFPSANGFVFASMKNMLLLSLIFSLIIIGTFYYTLRLILNQKKLGEIKTDFVNNMTHELKTPIATISLALDSINNPIIKNDEEKFRDYSRILKEENNKLNTHVERVLQMALLEKGKLQLYKAEADLAALIKKTIDGYKLQIAEKKAAVLFRNANDHIMVTADAFHLQTVFNNLLDNALKYSLTGCAVEIELSSDDQHALIIFKDNGIGIDKSQAEKVFEQFYREQGGNLHDVKGFGLGLSYARSIVAAHGGAISLQSEKGKGSSFTIKLPLHGR